MANEAAWRGQSTTAGKNIDKVEIGSLLPGTTATSLGKAEDAAASSGDVGVMVLAVRKDTAAGLAANGDYHVLEVDANGCLYIAPLPAGTAIVGKVTTDQTTHGTTDKVAADLYVNGALAATDNPAPVASRGNQITLLSPTTYTTNNTFNIAAVTGLDRYAMFTKILTISGKTMAGSATVNIYIQMSPDAGTTWLDIISVAQITSAALGNGVRMGFYNVLSGESAIGITASDGALAAGTVNTYDFCDRLRAKIVTANFNGTTDTITLAITAFMK
jgi:hypothetical protein